MKLNETLTDFLPISEEIKETIYEITPKDYVEAPCVLKINEKYHLMYSVGKWENSSYCVKAAVSDNPWGNFLYYADVMKACDIADGPGHNGIFNFNGEFYTAYHRRIIGDKNCHHRILCIDKLVIENDRILPVNITN